MLSAVHFSICRDAVWGFKSATSEAWLAWARGTSPLPLPIEPELQFMPSMQRRRLGFLGKIALDPAYACLGSVDEIPLVFCSRHGEVGRSVDLMHSLSTGEPLSPASFALSVHNSIAGAFSIARGSRADHGALSASTSTIEHGVVEACGLLADGEKAVLLVAYDCPLPTVFASFESVDSPAFAWAWLLVPPGPAHFSLSWSGTQESDTSEAPLEVLRYYLGTEKTLVRISEALRWEWSRHD